MFSICEQSVKTYNVLYISLLRIFRTLTFNIKNLQISKKSRTFAVQEREKGAPYNSPL